MVYQWDFMLFVQYLFPNKLASLEGGLLVLKQASLFSGPSCRWLDHMVSLHCAILTFYVHQDLHF